MFLATMLANSCGRTLRRNAAYHKALAIFLIGSCIYFFAHLNKLRSLKSVFVEHWNFSIKHFQEVNSLKREERPLLSNHAQQHARSNQKYVIPKIPSEEKHPVILVWTTSPFIEKKGIEFIAPEEYGSCRLTMNRNLLNKSIAVIIFNNPIKLAAMDIPDPKTRHPDQVYAFWTSETPAKMFVNRHLLENPLIDPIFNLSLSLARTADIQFRFGGYRRALEVTKRRKFTTDKTSSLWQKTKLAIWIVSNCHKTPGATERLLYAKSLVKAGLKLDKYGKCFKKNHNSEALVKIVKKYKFYLAFENSLHCPDYVSEKFWRNSIKAGLVPIVWGPTKQDVLRVAPPNSYIHVEDFKTPSDLVKRLNYLNRNYTAYMEYHKWRDVPVNEVAPEDFADNHKELLSNLCKRLLLEKHPRKSIPSISKLLYDTGYPDDECLRRHDIYSLKEQNEAQNF